MEKNGSAAQSANSGPPARPTMASKQPSKEELEAAQSLHEHSKEARNLQQPPQQIRKSQSPHLDDRTSPASTSSFSEETYDVVGSDREQSYAPTIAGSESAPTGQVCS